MIKGKSGKKVLHDVKDRRRSQAVENIREYSERLCRSRLARLHDYSYRQTSFR